MKAVYCMQCGSVLQNFKTLCVECKSTELVDVKTLVDSLYAKIETLEENKVKIRKNLPNF